MEHITWQQFQERNDIIGGHLEVFEGEIAFPESLRNFRGQITAAYWDAPMPVFHLASVQKLDLSTQTWSDAHPETVKICGGLVGHHGFLSQSGDGLFIFGWSTRYFFTPKGTTLPDIPALPPPISYEEFEEIFVAASSHRRSILGFK